MIQITGYVNENNTFVDKLNYNKMTYMINSRVYLRPKICIIKSMSSNIEFISLNIQTTK